MRLPVAARRRWGLPLSLSGRSRNVTVMSCADSGADDNFMALDVVHSLGLPLSSEQEYLKEFCIANGKVIKSLGKVVLPCNFSQGTASPDALATFFYVFRTLAEPIIMGLKFLELTETFSKHRDRLVELSVFENQPLRVLSIGVPRRNLVCLLAEDIVFAIADSGSDLDFVSEKYASSRNLTIIPNQERIMFADGTIETTSGVTRLPLLVQGLDTDDASNDSKSSVTLSREFHIFNGLVHDVLIGHATIEKLQVFTRFNSSLLPGFGLADLLSLNIIRHLKKVPTLKKITKVVWRRLLRHHGPAQNAPLTHYNDDDDQRENARRSAEFERIEALNDPAEVARARAKEDSRHKEYLQSRFAMNATTGRHHQPGPQQPIVTVSTSSLDWIICIVMFEFIMSTRIQVTICFGGYYSYHSDHPDN
ncbi:hypothetical protein TruAng_006834 [Truncatella angustata]|nr:hypothetical protein TruAng_006834 [Truncatella angustata]